MNKSNSGISTILIILLIFTVGLFVGGIFYFVGSQKSMGEPYMNGYSASSKASQSAKLETDSEIERQLNEIDEGSIDADFKGIDSDTASF